ncbi:MAG: universal stress protein [Myxococcota bacterium]
MANKLILVPIDLASPFRKPFETAVELASDLGASIELLYVEPTPMNKLPEHLRASLQEKLEAFAGDPGVPVTPKLRVGNPANEIVSWARTAEATMIVMGTHNRTGLARAIIGSIAEAVLRDSAIPVVVVPGEK